jgi:uncharacterized protein (TIGR02996 family)
MSDRDAFLAAIRAAPDDDAPRLVYADWLEENGDGDLADFIRLQIEIEAFRRPDSDLDRWRRATIDLHIESPVPDDFPAELHRYAELARREQGLLKARKWEWLAPLVRVDEDYNSRLSVTIHRGIAEEVGITTSAFLESGNAVREACPDLRRLTLYGPRDQVPELVASAALHGIPELELAGWITEYDARFLAGWLAFNSIRSLTLWLGSRADEDIIRTLLTGQGPTDPLPLRLQSPRLTTTAYLGDLRELVLVQLYGGLDAGDEAIAASQRAHQLAAAFNDAVGRNVARVEQPFARRFPLVTNVGYGIYAGHTREGPVLICDGRRPRLVRFDMDGRLIPERNLELIAQHIPPVRGWHEALNLREMIRILREKHEYKPGPIFVLEFVVDEGAHSVYLWGGYQDVVADPDARSDGEEHEDACASLHSYWMNGGHFVVYAGTDYIAGPDGKIHSS